MSALSRFRKAGEFVSLVWGFFTFVLGSSKSSHSSQKHVTYVIYFFLTHSLAVILPCSSSGFASSPGSSGSSAELVEQGFISLCHFQSHGCCLPCALSSSREAQGLRAMEIMEIRHPEPGSWGCAGSGAVLLTQGWSCMALPGQCSE